MKKTYKNRPVFILSTFDYPVPFEYCTSFYAPWKKTMFRNKISDLITLDNLRKWLREFQVFRNSLGAVKIEIWLTCTEELKDKELDYLISDTQSIASYVWPSEASDDEKGMRELEALLLNLLKQSNSGPLPQTLSVAAKASTK